MDRTVPPLRSIGALPTLICNSVISLSGSPNTISDLIKTIPPRVAYQFSDFIPSCVLTRLGVRRHLAGEIVNLLRKEAEFVDVRRGKRWVGGSSQTLTGFTLSWP